MDVNKVIEGRESIRKTALEFSLGIALDSLLLPATVCHPVRACSTACLSIVFRVESIFIDFYRVLLGFTRFYLVILSFTGFYWVLPSFTGFYLVLLGFTGFY